MGAPTGLSAFLFTDVEGSTRLWEDHTADMQVALEVHDTIMTNAIDRWSGYVFSTAGDAFAAAFHSPTDAVSAAMTIQRELTSYNWKEHVEIRIRIGIHVGEASERGGNYFGPTLNRAARLMSAAHGGQLVISDLTRELCENEPWTEHLLDLGLHQFKDLSAPERVWQVTVPGGLSEFARLRTIDRRVTNLPVQLTPFVGRENDLLEVSKHLTQSRLVTLRGLGGMGKTRLSLQIAASLFADFADGVWLIELAPVRDSDAVPFALTEALEIPAIGRPALDAAIDSIGQKSMLILLDNCEHVIEAASSLTETLLRKCPNVRILATSRQSLNVAGELTHNLQPLDGGSQDSAAVELFVQRALAANPNLAFDKARYEVVTDLCDHLDHVPLAIELAAARTRSMTPEDISNRLDQRFKLLRSNAGVADRHQRLVDTIEWSYSHLNSDEQVLFNRLSIFAGTFSLEAAQTVCADDDLDEFDIIDQLDALVEHSMIAADLSSTTTRYRLLETMRFFGQEQLGEYPELSARHAEYFASTVVEKAAASFGPDEAQARADLDLIWDDLRAAWSYARSLQDLRLSCALAGHLTYEVIWRSRMEPSIWAQSILEFEGFESANPLDRVGVLTTAAAGLMHSAEADTARTHLADAEALLSDIGPHELDHRVLAVTSVLFFTGSLQAGVDLCSTIMSRLDSPPSQNRVSALFAISKASMFGYLGRAQEAAESAALGSANPSLAPTWQALADWDQLRWSAPGSQKLIATMPSIEDTFRSVDNRFLEETAQRHLLSLKAATAELSQHLSKTADALSHVDLSDPRYATGWMLTGAIALLKANHYEDAAMLLAWQERHRAAPVLPSLQTELDSLTPGMRESLGPAGLSAIETKLGNFNFTQTVEFAIAALTRASTGLSDSQPALTVVAQSA